jgi:phosphohistidine swiveling domain-containing protein
MTDTTHENSIESAGTAAQRLAQVPPAQRILLLPHCLRDSQRCQATYGQNGLECKACKPTCAINRLRRAAKEAGYGGVCVAPGGSLAVEYVRQHRPRAIVAVACPKELEMGLEAVANLGQSPDWDSPVIMVIPLLKDGCVDTQVDVERALATIRLGVSRLVSHYVFSLDQISAADRLLTGGKAANLGELRRTGLPVPPGFVIFTTGYQAFVQENGLTELIATAPADESTALFAQAEMPADLEAEIIAAYRELNSLAGCDDELAVAVRSSATAEDQADASFAGQQDTMLNVRGEINLLRAVKQCWASLWSARAVAYRQQRGEAQPNLAMAVLVQQMVPAVTAGVIFTANPVTGDRSQVIIEAVPGLGEALVAGQITPHRYVANKEDGRPVKQQAGDDADRQPLLSDEQIQRLREVALRIEAHFDGPQDIEWAWAEDGLYVLQARPITTLSTPSADTTLWSRVWGDEYWADVVSPLFYSIFGRILSTNMVAEALEVAGLSDIGERPLLRLYRGHVYFNAGILRDLFEHVPPSLRTDALLSALPPEEAAMVRVAPFRLLRRLLAEVRLALLDRDGLIFRNYRRLEEYIPQLLARLKELDRFDLSRASSEDLLAYFGRVEQLGIEHLRLIRWGLVLHNMSLYQLLRYTLNNWCNDNGTLLAKLLTGLRGNKTTETNKALWDLSRAALASPVVAESFRQAGPEEILGRLAVNPEGRSFLLSFMRFIADYGHRSITRDISSPAWEEDPTIVISLLKGYITSGVVVDPYALEAHQVREREGATRQVLDMLHGPRRAFFKLLLSYTHHYMTFRENQRFYLDMIFLRWRRVFLEVGRRFLERGLVTTIEDVFYLRLDEIAQAIRQGWDEAKVPDLVAARKQEYAAYCVTLPPTFLRGEIGFESAPFRPTGELLRGVGVSPGRITGPARVLPNLAQSYQLQRGEILITVNTDPAWTPLFISAGGVVLETGGMLSHGAIVSREYGIPAVTGVRDATHYLHNGQIITVDGNQGIVSLNSK